MKLVYSRKLDGDSFASASRAACETMKQRADAAFTSVPFHIGGRKTTDCIDAINEYRHLAGRSDYVDHCRIAVGTCPAPWVTSLFEIIIEIWVAPVDSQIDAETHEM